MPIPISMSIFMSVSAVYICLYTHTLEISPLLVSQSRSKFLPKEIVCLQGSSWWGFRIHVRAKLLVLDSKLPLGLVASRPLARLKDLRPCALVPPCKPFEAYILLHPKRVLTEAICATLRDLERR